jgi:hypothetical protein
MFSFEFSNGALQAWNIKIQDASLNLLWTSSFNCPSGGPDCGDQVDNIQFGPYQARTEHNAATDIPLLWTIPVPEPRTFSIMLLGLAGLALVMSGKLFTLIS